MTVTVGGSVGEKLKKNSRPLLVQRSLDLLQEIELATGRIMQANYFLEIFPDIVIGDSDGESMMKKTGIGFALHRKIL